MDRRKAMGQEGKTGRDRETSETTLATGHSRCKIKHYVGKTTTAWKSERDRQFPFYTPCTVGIIVALPC